MSTLLTRRIDRRDPGGEFRTSTLTWVQTGQVSDSEGGNDRTLNQRKTHTVPERSVDLLGTCKRSCGAGPWTTEG